MTGPVFTEAMRLGIQVTGAQLTSKTLPAFARLVEVSGGDVEVATARLVEHLLDQDWGPENFARMLACAVSYIWWSQQ